MDHSEDARRAFRKTHPSKTFIEHEPQAFTTLASHLKVVETLDPQWYQSGKDWSQRLGSICDEVSKSAANLATADHGPAERYSRYRRSYTKSIPDFEDALKQIDWFDEGARERNDSKDCIIHFWKVATINPITNALVSMEGRPDGYRLNTGYRDHTTLGELPETWRQAHTQTKEIIRRWGVEEEQPENEFEQGWQDETSATGYIDTSMPF